MYYSSPVGTNDYSEDEYLYQYPVLKLTVRNMVSRNRMDILQYWHKALDTNIVEIDRWLKQQNLDYLYVIDDMMFNMLVVSATIFVSFREKSSAAKYKMKYWDVEYPHVSVEMK